MNIARNKEHQANIERIPIYDYSPKNAYLNLHNRLGRDSVEAFVVRTNVAREDDKNEPVEISEAELQRILREDVEISEAETAKIDSATRSKDGNRNEPEEISEMELKNILREDDIPSADELQEIMKESGATRDEVIATLRKVSKSKDILRKINTNSFVFPPNEKSQPLRITELDVQQILRNNGENSYAGMKPIARNNFNRNIFSAPHKLDVDFQKLIDEDVSRLKSIVKSRDDVEIYSAEDSDGMQNFRKSMNQKFFKPQSLKFDLEKLIKDRLLQRHLFDFLKARSNDGDLNVFEISAPKDVGEIPRKLNLPKKLNSLFKNKLPENSDALSDVIKQTQKERVSSDYFDIDYYLRRREQGRKNIMNYSNKDERRKSIGRHSKFNFI